MCVYRLHWFWLKVVQGVSEFALKWVFLAPLALVWAVLGASGYLVIDAINEVPQYLQPEDIGELHLFLHMLYILIHVLK